VAAQLEASQEGLSSMSERVNVPNIQNRKQLTVPKIVFLEPLHTGLNLKANRREKFSIFFCLRCLYPSTRLSMLLSPTPSKFLSLLLCSVPYLSQTGCGRFPFAVNVSI
jgi:hypothetical protein